MRDDIAVGEAKGGEQRLGGFARVEPGELEAAGTEKSMYYD